MKLNWQNSTHFPRNSNKKRFPNFLCGVYMITLQLYISLVQGYTKLKLTADDLHFLHMPKHFKRSILWRRKNPLLGLRDKFELSLQTLSCTMQQQRGTSIIHLIKRILLLICKTFLVNIMVAPPFYNAYYME